MESGGFELDCTLFAISELIDQAMDLVRSEAGKRNMEIIVPDTKAQIYGDQNLLVRVLGNLLSNAIKFSNDGSNITIAVEDAPQWVEVSVSDLGRGIPATHVEKVFDRFQQVIKSDSHEKGGSGLGLAICKAIVVAHHGTIRVKSKEGEGSTFSFRIPYSQAKSAEQVHSNVAKTNE